MFTIAIYAVLIVILGRDLRGPDRDFTRMVCIHDEYLTKPDFSRESPDFSREFLEKNPV
jgi:hypothetical protein